MIQLGRMTVALTGQRTITQIQMVKSPDIQANIGKGPLVISIHLVVSQRVIAATGYR